MRLWHVCGSRGSAGNEDKQTRRDTGRHLCRLRPVVVRRRRHSASWRVRARPGGPTRLLEDQGPDLFRPRRPDDRRQPWPLLRHPQGRPVRASSTYEDALRWERYYIVAGTIQGLVAGLFAFVALYWAPDVFGEVAAISSVLASTITIAGRNFGSRKMVAILALSVLGPIALGLMLKGDFYHFVLGPVHHPVHVHHQQDGASRADGAVHRHQRGEEGEPHRGALQPGAEHHVARPRHARSERPGRGRECGSRPSDVVQVAQRAAGAIDPLDADARRGGRHARPEGLQVHRGTADARASRGPGPQGPRFAFERPAFRVLGPRGQPGTRRHHLRGRHPARRSGGKDPLHGALRQSDRPAEPRLFPRAGRRNHVDRRPRPLLRTCRARSRRLQERQRHARPSRRRRPDLRRRGATCRLRQRYGQGQPLRRRRVHDLHRPRRGRKPSDRHPRPDVRGASGRDRRRRPRAAYSGQRRRRAVARQGHRCRRHDRQGRPCPLQGQGARQERLAAVRGGDGCRLPQPSVDEGRSARRDRGQGAARRLPADRDDGHDAHRQLRGAVPLGTSRPRPDLAGGLHSACRRNGHDLGDQPFRSAGSLHRMRSLAGARSASRSTCRPRISATATSSKRCATRSRTRGSRRTGSRSR